MPRKTMQATFDIGLPIGLQLIGRPLKEATLLRIAATYEAVGAWSSEPGLVHKSYSG